MGFITSTFKHEILTDTIKNLTDNRLYIGLSYAPENDKDFLKTQRESENLVWDNLIILIKVTTDDLKLCIPRYEFKSFSQDFGTNKFFCTNEEDIDEVKSYFLVKAGNGVATEMPVHESGDKTYSDGYTWRFLQKYTFQLFNRYSTKAHVYIDEDVSLSIEQDVDSIITSTKYLENVPCKINMVSLLIDPLDDMDKPISSDSEWYCQRIKISSRETGDIMIPGTEYSGKIVHYDSLDYAYVILNGAPRNIDKIKFTETNNIYGVLDYKRSQVKRNSGYTLFLQKFKTVFTQNTVKIVISTNGLL